MTALHAVGIVLLIALGDSINPATVGPALYLATVDRSRRKVAGFMIGVVAVNFAAGLVIMLGPGQLILALVPKPTAATKHIIQLVVGIVLLGLAGFLWSSRHRLARHKLPALESKEGSSLALGAGLGLIELPTALPYFAAIAVIAGANLRVVNEVLLLALYNVVFVWPIAMILLLLALLGERARGPLRRINDGLQRHWPVLSAGLAATVGAVVGVLGVVGLVNG